MLGVGKTSLIKSIVQVCEDIVHVDTTSPDNATLKKTTSGKKSSSPRSRPTRHIVEISASTKAYPPWWSEIEESSILRRRKSGDEAVLERNLCFVDTPGYDAASTKIEGMERVLQYIEDQMFKQLRLETSSDADLQGLVGGNGGSQVDLVLYLLTEGTRLPCRLNVELTSPAPKPHDTDFIRKLSELTNVLPVIAKADTLPADEAEQLKHAVSEEMYKMELQPFSFAPTRSPLTTPHLVCSLPANDLENMDASLLMQSDYIQPLVPSDLTRLLRTLFTPDAVAHLKHASAKKILQNRQSPRAHAPVPSPLRTFLPPSFARAPSTPLAGLHSPTTPAVAPVVAGYTQARLADHTQREERAARLHLARWATDLRRSLAGERARYAALARAERSEWLKARLGACVVAGDSDHVVRAGSRQRVVERAAERLEREKLERELGPWGPCGDVGDGERGEVDPADPLGLVGWEDAVRANGWVLLRTAGEVAILGAVTYLAANLWDWRWLDAEYWRLGR